jgi:hypothetical protein
MIYPHNFMSSEMSLVLVFINIPIVCSALSSFLYSYNGCFYISSDNDVYVS